MPKIDKAYKRDIKILHYFFDSFVSLKLVQNKKGLKKGDLEHFSAFKHTL